MNIHNESCLFTYEMFIEQLYDMPIFEQFIILL